MASLVPCRVRMADKVLWTEQAFAFEALHAPRSRAGVGFGKDKTLAQLSSSHKKKKKKRPWHWPKHSCCTLNEKGDLGSQTEALGGLLSRRWEHSRSASDLVISPHWLAVTGRTVASLSSCNCSAEQVEQKICRCSHAWLMSSKLNFSSTLLRICGRQSLYSPPTAKQLIFSPSRVVSSRLLDE